MKRKRHFLIRTALALFMVLCSTMGWGQTVIYQLDLAAQNSAFGTSNSYSAKSGTVNGVTWHTNAASCQSTAAVWLGTNSATNRTNLTKLSAGVNNRGGAIATALGITTSDVGYYAIVGSNVISNVGSIKVKAAATGGTAPSTLWCLYTSDGGASYTVLSSVSNPGTVEQTFTPPTAIANAEYAFVFYSSTYGTYRTPYFRFYEPACTTPTYSFAAATVNKITADAPFINAFTSDNPSPEVYSSSDTNVATVNATTGEVTIVGVGTTTIAVTQVADGNYCEVSDSYTLNVTSSSPSLAISGNTDNGATCINTQAAVQNYTITNSGNSAAGGLTVVSNNSQFVVSNLSATTVSGSNGTVTFDVTFTPTSAGVQNATITVQSSTSGSNVATFDITGTGNTTVDPALATSAATSISATEATLNGDITSLGTCLSNPLTEKGFVYGTSVNPEFNGGTFLTDGTAATGVFDATVTTLSPATTYYYKAYVVDGTGQYYFSNELSFTTTLDAPVATAATNISHNGFTANWNAVTGADSYVLEVNEVITVPVSDTEQFESGLDTSGYEAGWSANLIGGSWTLDYILRATGTNAYGATYSAQLRAADGKLTSPGFDKPTSITFYAKSSGNILKISKKINGVTTLVENVTLLGSFNLFNVNINETSNNVQIIIEATGGSAAYLDQLTINYSDVTTSSLSGSPFTITGPATSYDVTGLNPDADYTYTVKAVKGTVESAVSNTINVTTSPAPASTTYAGGSWTNGAPNSPDTDAVISENYNGAGFTAKDVFVESGAALTVSSGQTFSAANITVEDNANFIQEDGSTLNLTGTMTLNKNATSDATKYVFWSSPVQNQNVYDMYPAGTPQFVMTYDSDTDMYPTVANPTIAAAGVGYSVKVPVSATAAQFIGAPNSGDVIVNLDHVANANGNTWNLIGNPYPSNLNLQSLYNGGGIGSSIYFWDNISATNTTQQQAATTWAVYNAANGTWSNTGNAGLGIDGNNNLVKPGQGFIVQATAPSITFTNAMRSAATANFINKGMNPGEGKFWLKLATPSGTQFQTAITYGGGALNTLEAFDSKVMSVGANGIYSYLGADKLAIQGRDYFVNTDVVILGNKHSASGQYTFSLAGKTGLFDAGQAIYLKDKQTNIYTNLQTDSYTFLSDALEQHDRFEIVYQPQAALGTAETVKTETVVYKDGDHFTVKASEKILSIEVYDASGRHIGTVKPDSTTAQVTAGSRGMYLLKIKTLNSETVKKVIK